MPEKFTSLTAVAAPYDAMNVDTDQIIPARFLKFPRQDGYAKFLFHDVAEHPDFVLNRAAFRAAKILVGNRNFGCGSSREGAAYALFDRGLRSVIAPSFGDIFHNNCLKNGILPVRLSDEICRQLRALLSDHPGSKLTVDLVAQEVREPGGKVHGFTVDGFYREMLLKGLDELGLTLTFLPQIEAFERAYDVLG
jgi:3-isopropylmalate/(R)-2-methylmalate dehydratase small subunit